MTERDEGDGDRADVPLVRAFTVLVRRRRWIAGSALVLAAVAAAIALSRERNYTSVSSFTTQSRRSQAIMSGLAAQFGISVPGGEASQSPQFYADFVRGRAVLGATADTRFADAEGGMSTLVALLGLRRGDSARTRELLMANLASRIAASVNARTGVVRVRVRMNGGELAQAVNVRLLDLLNEFNLKTRQSQASAERAFTEGRMMEAKAELRASEDRLQAFFERNRDFRSSPPLSFAVDRLQREVAVRQQVVSTLAEAFEQARIEEVRDTPVITVIELPEVPARPDSRGLIPLVLLALAFGAATGMVGVLLGEALAGLRESDDHSLADLRDELSATPGLGRLVGRNRAR